jgi:hypothetical protein
VYSGTIQKKRVRIISGSLRNPQNLFSCLIGLIQSYALLKSVTEKGGMIFGTFWTWDEVSFSIRTAWRRVSTKEVRVQEEGKEHWNN